MYGNIIKRKLQKCEILSMIKHASEDLGDANKQRDENNEINKTATPTTTRTMMTMKMKQT